MYGRDSESLKPNKTILSLIREPDQSDNSSLVSIIIPVYNGLKGGVLKCLKSIVIQKYPNIELIIVNDNTPDNSMEEITKLLMNANIDYHIYCHEKNQGLSATWNDGILHSRGDFILLIQQDCSLSSSEEISKAVNFLIKKPDTILIGFQIVELSVLNLYQTSFLIRIGEYSQTPKNPGQSVITENKCDMMKREVIERIGEFDLSLKNIGQDFIFSKKAIELGISMEISKSLCYNIEYLGESTLKELVFKEFRYAKSAYAVFRNWSKSQYLKKVRNSFASLKLRNRIGNIILPLVELFLIAFYLVTFSGDIIFLLFGNTLIWISLSLLRIKKSLRHLTYHKLSFIIYCAGLHILLDFVYMLGFLIGFYNAIVHE